VLWETGDSLDLGRRVDGLDASSSRSLNHGGRLAGNASVGFPFWNSAHPAARPRGHLFSKPLPSRLSPLPFSFNLNLNLKSQSLCLDSHRRAMREAPGRHGPCLWLPRVSSPCNGTVYRYFFGQPHISAGVRIARGLKGLLGRTRGTSMGVRYTGIYTGRYSGTLNWRRYRRGHRQRHGDHAEPSSRHQSDLEAEQRIEDLQQPPVGTGCGYDVGGLRAASADRVGTDCQSGHGRAGADRRSGADRPERARPAAVQNRSCRRSGRAPRAHRIDGCRHRLVNLRQICRRFDQPRCSALGCGGRLPAAWSTLRRRRSSFLGAGMELGSSFWRT